MLLECKLVSRTWRASELGLSFDPNNRHSLADWFSLWESMVKEEAMVISVIIMLWSIWKERNKIVFDHKVFNIECVLQ